MAIFLNAERRVMIQGITGSEGRKHGARMLAAGTRVVGGTNPKKAGQTVELNGSEVPVFGTVADTMAATGAMVGAAFLGQVLGARAVAAIACVTLAAMGVTLFERSGGR